jgi:hypothetical protein
MALTVSFVRHRERRDRVYVTRPDGSSTGWDFPSYGDRLPHDLCHLVVEETLGIVDGFWGLVAQGVEVSLVDDQATLVRDGKPVAQEAGIDLSGLMAAEALVALLGPTGITAEQIGALAVAPPDPSSASGSGGGQVRRTAGVDLLEQFPDDVITSVRQRLDDIGVQWRDLGDGDAIILTYAAGRR